MITRLQHLQNVTERRGHTRGDTLWRYQRGHVTVFATVDDPNKDRESVKRDL